jgi:hypothetical protein
MLLPVAVLLTVTQRFPLHAGHVSLRTMSFISSKEEGIGESALDISEATFTPTLDAAWCVARTP